MSRIIHLSIHIQKEHSHNIPLYPYQEKGKKLQYYYFVLVKYEYLPHRHAYELCSLKRFYCGNHWIQMLPRGPVRRRRTQHLRVFFKQKFEALFFSYASMWPSAPQAYAAPAFTYALFDFY